MTRPAPPVWSLLAAVPVFWLAPAPASAQADQAPGVQAPPPNPTGPGWVGRRVIASFGTVLRGAGDTSPDPLAREFAATGRTRQEFRVYKVERVEGDRLWVISESGSTRGWFLAVEAIPLEQAVAHFTARIAADPGDAYNYTNRAVVYTVLGDLDRALLDDGEAIRRDPGNAMAYHNRGFTWAKKGQYDRAIADFTRAVELDPQYARAFNKRGVAWLEKKQYARAEADFAKAIKIEPKFARAYHNLGNAKARQGQYDQAITDYTQAARLDPYDTLAFVDRASAEHSKGDDERALADLDEAIRRDPASPAALVDRAWLLATSPSASVRDGKRAVADATRACEMTGWKEPYCLGTLAAAWAERGDFARAAKYQERAQRLYKIRDDVAKGAARLALYKASTPYREPAPAASADRPGPRPLAPSAMGHAPAHPGRNPPGGRGA